MDRGWWNEAILEYLQRRAFSLEPVQEVSKGFDVGEVEDIQWASTSKALDSILEDHQRWLDSEGAEGKRAILTGVILQKADLSDARLSGADLSGAILSEANLSGAEIRGADLSEVMLNLSDLSEADLSQANLSESNLVEADLSDVLLKGADLSGAGVTGANLSDSYLEGADVSRASLWEADLSDAVLYKANLSCAGLRGADLQGAYIYGADLSEAGLDRVCLVEADLSSSDLSGALLEDSNLSRAKLVRSNLSNANLEGANFSGADLSGSNLSAANTRNTEFVNAYLNDADVSDAEGLQSKQLRGASLSLTTLPDAAEEFAGLNTAKVMTQSAKKLFISVLVACAYAVLAIGVKAADSGVAGSSTNIELPIIGLSMGTGPFYLITPSLLALLFGYFHLQMQRLWEEPAQLPAIFPDGKPLDEKIHPWLITGLLRAHTKMLRQEPFPSFFRVQYAVAILLVWAVVPVALIWFTAMYSLESSALGGLYLHVLAAVTTAGAIAAYWRAARTLELQEYRPIRFWRPDSSDDGKWVLRSRSFQIGAAIVLFAFTVWCVRWVMLGRG